MIKFLRNIDIEKISEKFTAAVVYSLLSSVAMNFFFQPGHVYASGITGLSQIISELASRMLGSHVAQAIFPVSVTIYLLNLPLFVLAWFKLGHRFTLYTILTVTLSSIAIHFMPVVVLTKDPIINAVFGGAVMGFGVGYVFRNAISSGGTDIISLYFKKKTGQNVGVISTIFNGVVVLLAGVLFGWHYMFYSFLTIFVSGRVTDAIFSKQKKMQVMIVTKHSDDVKLAIYEKLHRGVTIMHGAEGGYTQDRVTILITVITGYEYPEFREIMKQTDPQAFVTMAQNVKIIGNFEDDKEK